MSETRKPIRRMVASILALVLLSGVGGFYLARLPVFLYPRTRVAAQYQTIEYVNPWAGIKVMQYPNDLLLYQQIIVDQEPDFIVETGTNFGGLCLYLSSVLEWVKPEARILTVDIDGQWYKRTLDDKPKNTNIRKLFDRIEFVEGSSTAPEVIAKFKKRIGTGKKVLVILDSWHGKDHVLEELKLYGEMVHPGGYIVVTDTHLDAFDRMEGPLAAIRAFLPDHPEFTQDRSLERYIISANHSGWLRKRE